MQYKEDLTIKQKVYVMAVAHKTSQGKIEDENEYKHMVDLPQTSFTLKASYNNDLRPHTMRWSSQPPNSSSSACGMSKWLIVTYGFKPGCQ